MPYLSPEEKKKKYDRAVQLRNEGYTIKECQAKIKQEFGTELDNSLYKDMPNKPQGKIEIKKEIRDGKVYTGYIRDGKLETVRVDEVEDDKIYKIKEGSPIGGSIAGISLQFNRQDRCGKCQEKLDNSTIQGDLIICAKCGAKNKYPPKNK